MFIDLAIEVEGIGVDCNQTRIIVEDLQKMDRLLNLVFARQQQQDSSIIELLLVLLTGCLIVILKLQPMKQVLTFCL